MGKQKTTGNNLTEKGLAKLMELMKKQKFETVDDINDFLKNKLEQSLDELPERTDKKGRSQDLVYEAYELPVSKGKKLVKQALELDPNNVNAYNYLAMYEKNMDKTIDFYEKAIKAGEKSLGKKFFKENKGYFWGLIETRPYMQAKAGLARCFYAKQETDKSIEIYKELLKLNPRDNQGIRYLLSPLLLGIKDLSHFEKFIKENDNEDCAVWNYNNALHSFKKLGRAAKSEKLLLQAYKSNAFVIDYLLRNSEMPEELPEYIGRGDENEAIAYVNDAWQVWNNTDGAFEWVSDFKQKRLKIN